jgi:tRNA 2-thiouridine synthesizing protein E
VLKVDGVRLPTTQEGFLLNPDDWSEQVAELLSSRMALELTEAHWEIIRFIRAYYLKFNHLPNTRLFTKAIQKALGDEKGSTRYLYRLFPDGPLKCACLLGGLPRPPGCL